MKGSNQISTTEEKEIAKNLSNLRAGIFLESRAFMRECLATLFDMNPLKIPLRAYPGEIPKIPKEIGNISISHTEDILIVIWHKEKVGIDIERSNRNFNYQSLAKKYFKKNLGTKDFNKLNQNEILNHWSAIEAAIKWEGGKIANDLRQWKYIKNEEKILHEKKQLKLKLSQFEYMGWTISIAMESNIYENHEFIICDKVINLS